MVTGRLHKFLKACLEEEDFADCFLVEFKESASGNKVEIFIESDGDLSYGTLRKLSRMLEAEIEENNWMPEKYTLDVSSPGIGRPLTHHRQYVKNIGRHIEVNTAEDTIKGILSKVEEEEIEVEVELSKKQAKVKGHKTEHIMIRKEQIVKAKIKVSFK